MKTEATLFLLLGFVMVALFSPRDDQNPQMYWNFTTVQNQIKYLFTKQLLGLLSSNELTGTAYLLRLTKLKHLHLPGSKSRIMNAF